MKYKVLFIVGIACMIHFMAAAGNKKYHAAGTCHEKKYFDKSSIPVLPSIDLTPWL